MPASYVDVGHLKNALSYVDFYLNKTVVVEYKLCFLFIYCNLYWDSDTDY